MYLVTDGQLGHMVQQPVKYCQMTTGVPLTFDFSDRRNVFFVLNLKHS